MKFFSVVILTFLLSVNSYASFDHGHKDWDIILKNFVQYDTDGEQTLFNYKLLKKKFTILDGYLATLSDVTKKQFDQFSKKQQLAFLINSYNAFTVKIILDHYPVKSIKDIGSFFKNTWKIKFVPLLGEKMHLDRIEHELIRPVFNEHRIHFAVNCASIGCPRLSREAFVADKLDQQLKEMEQKFLSYRKKNWVDHKKKKLHLSKIFKWYKKDFIKGRNLREYVAPLIEKDPKLQKKILSDRYSIDFESYDWGLNQVP